MQPFVEHEGIVVPLNRANVDTDAIIPKQFLKGLEKKGLGRFLFYEWRYHEDDSLNESFVLNKPSYNGASILLAKENFGTGSSREHAPWSLLDFGIKVIIAPSFADIFYNNCFKNGILPITLPKTVVDQLFEVVLTQERYTLFVDLNNQMIRNQNMEVSFEIDSLLKERLLKGLDDITLTLQFEKDIEKFNSKRAPWLDPYK